MGKPQQERTDLEVARGVPFAKRVPPDATQLQEIAAGIRARQGAAQGLDASMHATAVSIGIRPAMPGPEARAIAQHIGLRDIALLVQRIIDLEERVAQLEARR